MKIICKTKINACACIQNIFLLFRRDANDFWISWDCEISEKGVRHNGLKCLIIRARISSLWKYLFKKCVYVIKTLNEKQNVLKKFLPPPLATIEENSISKNKQDILTISFGQIFNGRNRNSGANASDNWEIRKKSPLSYRLEKKKKNMYRANFYFLFRLYNNRRRNTL